MGTLERNDVRALERGDVVLMEGLGKDQVGPSSSWQERPLSECGSHETRSNRSF